MKVEILILTTYNCYSKDMLLVNTSGQSKFELL